jgi:hypothetical protein
VDQLHDKGFVRVHRHFAVNARRVCEIKRGFRGQLSLVMDPGSRQTVPVSRRREAAVRRALDLLSVGRRMSGDRAGAARHAGTGLPTGICWVMQCGPPPP